MNSNILSPTRFKQRRFPCAREFMLQALVVAAILCEKRLILIRSHDGASPYTRFNNCKRLGRYVERFADLVGHREITLFSSFIERALSVVLPPTSMQPTDHHARPTVEIRPPNQAA